jgi:hypothetical protein
MSTGKPDGNNGRNAKDGKYPSDSSPPSHQSPDSDRIIPPRGDYRTLLSFQKAEVVYDLIFRFARNRSLPK